MQFTKLTAENFGSLGTVKLDLENQGLVVVTGRNEDAGKADSNGAGKSLLLEAFCWCLWGKTIRGLSGDDVVNTQVGKDCFVDVQLIEGAWTYTIQRTRKGSEGKPNDVRVWRCMNVGEFISQEMTAASMAQTQEIINTLLGLDFQTFCVMMPGAGARASEMTDKEVKWLLEKLLQTEDLGTAHKACRVELKKRQHAQTVAATERSALENALNECEVRMGDLKEKWESYEGKKKQQIVGMQAEAVSLLAQIAAQDDTLRLGSTLDAKILEAESKVYSQTLIIEESKEAFRKSDQLAVRAIEACRLEQGAKQLEHLRQMKRIEGIPEGTNCPTCAQDVLPQHRKRVVDKIGLLLKDLNQEILELDIEMTIHQDKRTEGTRSYMALRDRLLGVRDLHASDVTRLKQLQQDQKTAKALKDQLETQLTSLQARQQALENEDNPFQGLIAKTAEEAYEKAAQAARKLKELRLLEHEIAVYEYWLTGFSPQGVRSFLLEHVTPILNEAAQKYADLLTDGEMSVTFHTQQRLRSGKMVEKFNIGVSNVHGGQSYAACSAGERSRANLCVAFALGDLASMRASKRISFRFLDEPFESVDESGTDAIMALLNDQKDRFDSVFVITHQDHFKQLFPKKLTIVKQDGMSYLMETA